MAMAGQAIRLVEAAPPWPVSHIAFRYLYYTSHGWGVSDYGTCEPGKPGRAFEHVSIQYRGWEGPAADKKMSNGSKLGR